MSDAAPPIDYASHDLESPGDRLLRRVAAWSAIVYGGEALIRLGLHVALAKGWVASPPSMSWAFGGQPWDVVQRAALALTMAGLVSGGVLLLRRVRASVVVLRAGVACSILLSALGLATAIRDSPEYASYWSTPAAAAFNAVEFLSDLWLPILIGLLTLPPLARRMV